MENASGKAAMWKFLKHPLFLLLVTFALTGIIVPAIARSWQIRQKELEIKIDLVSDVSESVMTLLMAIQFVHVMPRRYPDGADRLSEFQQNLDKRFSEWEVRRSVIGTKLEAYLPAAWRRPPRRQDTPAPTGSGDEIIVNTASLAFVSARED